MPALVAAGSPVTGRSGCGGDSGNGSGAAPNAGVTTAQGLAGVQPERLLETELAGGVTTATVLGAPRTCARAGTASTAQRATRQGMCLTWLFPVLEARGNLGNRP